MDDIDLQLNFAVCFDHFQNKEDEALLLGSKDNSPNDNESESIELVTTPSNNCRGPLQESTISSASTNNTDICVLDCHYDYASEDLQFLPDDDENDCVNEFVESEEGDEVFLRAVDVLDKNEDFTVLQKPIKSRRLCNCDESTEVLLLINSEYHGQRKPTYSGTDSDIEVLMSEEIIESDWSSGNIFKNNVKEKPSVGEDSQDLKQVFEQVEEITSPSCLHKSCDGNSLPTQESTDLDVSVDELVDGAVSVPDMYQHLNRIQLLKLIQQQEVRIQALEATVERYHKAQKRLFEHVDALRLELSEIRISPLQNMEKLEENQDGNE